jgi:hypothetical protein
VTLFWNGGQTFVTKCEKRSWGSILCNNRETSFMDDLLKQYFLSYLTANHNFNNLYYFPFHNISLQGVSNVHLTGGSSYSMNHTNKIILFLLRK